MKPKIHPKYQQATVLCASCKNDLRGRPPPGPELRVDVCNSCPPFFTGKQMILDTAGQVERFQRRLERTQRA